jgi:tetratricopeptide (TPR) repeat protein
MLQPPSESATYTRMEASRRPPATLAAAVLLVALLALPVRIAAADQTPPPAPAVPTAAPVAADTKAAVDALIAKIAAAGPADGRLAAAEKLRELAPRAVPALADLLARSRASSVDERRAVLRAIDAAVPDASGKFSRPGREKASEIKKDDELDWLPALMALTAETPAPPPDAEDKKAKKKKADDEAVEEEEAPAPSPTLSATAISEVVTDVALIRALAASRDFTAAAPIFNAAFNESTMLYRDECGRYLRKMEPLSIPVLTIESQKDGDRRRYATYQLERLDRQDPGKALSSATSDESLLIAILDAFRTSKHREAVYAVFDYIDKDSPRVREAARKAWLGYVTGKPPKDAPKRKMVLPGGKLAEKETPMWLTYRELATEKLRKASEELLGEPVGAEEKLDVEDVSKRIFAHYDGIRAKKEAVQWDEAKALAAKGDLAGAAARLDQLLAVNPDRSERAEMAAVYMTYAKELQRAEKWTEAAAAFSTAVGLSPDGAMAKDAAAGRDFTLGKSMEAAGKDGTGLYRRAAVAKPDFEEAQVASGDLERPRWMLYVASAAGLLAIALAAIAASRRRRLA